MLLSYGDRLCWGVRILAAVSAGTSARALGTHLTHVHCRREPCKDEMGSYHQAFPNHTHPTPAVTLGQWPESATHAPALPIGQRALGSC